MAYESELEECVGCYKITEVKKSTPIDLRKDYIEGAGQLCDTCYEGIYLNPHELNRKNI